MIYKLTLKHLVIVASIGFAVLLCTFVGYKFFRANGGRSNPQTTTKPVTQIGPMTNHDQLDFSNPLKQSEETTKSSVEPSHPNNPVLAPRVNPPTTPVPTTPVPAPSPPVNIIPDVIYTNSKSGIVPVFYRINTTQPVVFLTIDDGYIKEPEAIKFMKDHNIVASLFLNDSKVSDNYDYFRTLQSNGSVVENHTVNHPNLTKLSYTHQKKEICDNADRFATAFGSRPKLFRPPFGSFNENTRRAAAACGMTALVHWHAKANNGSMQYQQSDKLKPGDIVLMHFHKEFVADIQAFYNAAQKEGLKTVLLEDWIK